MSTDTNAAVPTAELLRRVQELEDKEAIRDLYAHYGWLVDSHEWGRVPEEIFTEDATLILGSDMIYHGREEIRRAYSDRLMSKLEATAHYFTNMRIDLEGDGKAGSQAYFQSYHWTQETSGNAMRPTDFVGVGVYLDQLVRQPEGWRIVHRRRGLIAPGPLGHGALPASMTTTMKGWGQTDQQQ